jgi:hypothetical protein
VLSKAKLRRISDNCSAVNGFSGVKSVPVRHLFALGYRGRLEASSGSITKRENRRGPVAYR